LMHMKKKEMKCTLILLHSRNISASVENNVIKKRGFDISL
jgi:hypothetical protein